LKRRERDKQDHAAKEEDANKIDLTLTFLSVPVSSLKIKGEI
jgi:hypothetical protein